MNQYDRLIGQLREPTWGHGAFGESEHYDPPQLQLDAANAIEKLQSLCKKYALQKLTAEEQTLLELDT